MKKFMVKQLLALFTVLLFATNIANAAIRVAPSYVELNANKVKKDYITGSFSITGGKDENIRFKIYPVFFEYDSKGNFVELPDTGQKNSLMGKVKFFPSEFTCVNGLEQRVRFTVTDLKSLPQGESRLVLFLEDVDTKEVLIKKADGGIGGKILVKTRVGVPIYLDKGFFTKKGTFDTVALKKDADGYACEYRVSSKGNSKIRYTGTAYLTEGNKLIKQMDIHGMAVAGGKYVEKSQLLDIPKDLLKDDKEYKIKFVMKYKDEKQNDKTLKKEITFLPNKVTSNKVIPSKI